MRRGEVHTGFLVRKPEGRGTAEIPRRRCEDNIKMYLKKQDGEL
jgi:hypothetical protein